jgi:hypothetical protein
MRIDHFIHAGFVDVAAELIEGPDDAEFARVFGRAGVGIDGVDLGLAAGGRTARKSDGGFAFPGTDLNNGTACPALAGETIKQPRFLGVQPAIHAH